MAVISRQTTIWFIKLGEKGNWEKSCIEDEGTIRIGYENPYHENSLAGDWEPVYACCLAWRNEHHFVFIGSTPYTIWLQDAIEVDGFVETGVQIAESWPLRRQPFLLETSLPGIFCCGRRAVWLHRAVASAVSKGAMAVHFVHEYLASS